MICSSSPLGSSQGSLGCKYLNPALCQPWPLQSALGTQLHPVLLSPCPCTHAPLMVHCVALIKPPTASVHCMHAPPCTALLMPPTVSVHCMHSPCCTAHTSPHECALHAHTLLTPPTAFCIADCSSQTRSSLHAHHTAGVHNLPSHTQTAPAAHTAQRSTAMCLGAPTSLMHTITHLRCTPALHGQLTLHTPCAHTSHHIKFIAPCPSSTFSCSGRASVRTSCPCALPA